VAGGCASGSWAFSSTVSYSATYGSGGYAAPGPPADQSSATVPCSPAPGGGASSGASSGTPGGPGAGAAPGGTSGPTGGGGVQGSHTNVPGRNTACIVPKVNAGARLRDVENSLRRAHCEVGPITRVRTATIVRNGRVVRRKVPAGRVVALSVPAGRHLKARTKVGIEVSRG
jgi:hypothetical protein